MKERSFFLYWLGQAVSQVGDAFAFVALPLSLAFARRAAGEMEADKPDTFTTDCSLSALQIEAVRGVKPSHPTLLLREAYGLPEEH